MFRALQSVIIVLAIAAAAFAQSPFVTITGNSIAHFQAPFAGDEFSQLPSNEVYIWGADSQPCSYFTTLGPTDQPLIYYYVPAQTTVAVLIDSTNDVAMGTPVAVQVSCMEQTIQYLLQRNPAIKIVVANTPPWTHYNPCLGTNNPDSVLQLIQAYNSAYADPVNGLEAMFPGSVMVADVYTPSSAPNGWALPIWMSGPCGIHPGQEFIWSPSWSHFSKPYVALVDSALNGGW